MHEEPTGRSQEDIRRDWRVTEVEGRSVKYSWTTTYVSGPAWQIVQPKHSEHEWVEFEFEILIPYIISKILFTALVQYLQPFHVNDLNSLYGCIFSNQC